jgi:hypothetical protein
MKEVVDVRGDGNCFYRAVYGYVLHNNNLHIRNMGEFLQIFQCDKDKILQANVSSVRDHFASDKGIQRLYSLGQEDLWEQCVRKFLASYVHQNPRILEEQLQLLNSMYSSGIYEDIKDSYTDWFGKAFPTKPPENVKIYAKEFAKNVLKSGTDACDIDIYVISKILNFYGLTLRISPIPRSDDAIYNEYIINSHNNVPRIPEPNTIYLIRVPGHYNFVKFKPDVQHSAALRSPTASRSLRSPRGSRSPRSSSTVPGSMIVGGTAKIMWTNGKIYKKFYDKEKKKHYIRQKNKKVYI